MTGPARFEAQVSLQFFDLQIESSKSLANRKGQMSHMTSQPEKAGKSWEKLGKAIGLPMAYDLLCGSCGFLVPSGDSEGC